jgi:protein SCO1/2
VGVALVLALVAPVLAVEQRPEALRDVGYDQHLGASVPLDLHFQDETGATVRLGDYFGERPVVLMPAYYTCPMLCTLVWKGLVSALRPLAFDVGKEFTVITFSFDPHDGPAQAAAKKATLLEEYRRPTAAAGWHFLTGDAASIAALTQAIGFRYAYDEAHQQFAHASGIVVLTPDGRIARYLFGIEYAPKDLRLALVEASEHHIGSLVDELLLFCFHYDPATGRYGRVAIDALRVGAVATLLALGTFIALALRRDARRSVRG